MKLDETNSKFAVVKNAFHGGGTISFHNSLNAALKAEKKYINFFGDYCAIVPVTEEAYNELIQIGYLIEEYDEHDDEIITLYKDLSCYTGNEHYSTICK